jgi:hypothetical protein
MLPAVSTGNWDGFVLVVTALVILASVIAISAARPRSQVLVPYASTLIVSIVVYVSMVHGASSFHTAFLICCAVAIGVALVLVLVRPAWNRLAMFTWAMLGVVTPFIVFFGFLAVVCLGKTECLG